MKLTHPTTGASIEVDPDHADIYLTQGWAEAKATKKPVVPKPDPDA